MKDLPEELTTKNIPRLIEKARKIKKKATLVYKKQSILWVCLCNLALVFSPFITLLILIMFFFLFEFFPLFLNINEVVALMFGCLFVIYVGIWRLLQRITALIFKMPKLEERIFSRCFIIADCIRRNQKELAIINLRYLRFTLKHFLRDKHNPKSKAYEPEFNLLLNNINSMTPISRLLLLAEEPKFIARLLMSFSLAFVRGEDQKAFPKLRKLVYKIAKHNKPKGKRDTVYILKIFLGSIGVITEGIILFQLISGLL